MNAALGGDFVNNFIYKGRIKKVFVQGDAYLRDSSGKLTAINRWLEEKIWKYGCMKDPVALFESVCGPFRPEEYVAYLEKKFTEVYEL